ncbi:hypothetical protein LY76DRAFT_609116 [Colletotrichum caudatum]|nr:hypothetical protein LY76DRAFT_609116 [Colletotrichum caudatum]
MVDIMDAEHEIEFYGQYILITYNRSRVTDHTKLYEYLMSSMKTRLPTFSRRTHLRKAQDFAVQIPVGNEYEWDTMSIRLQPLKRGESPAWFLEYTQSSFCQEGNVKLFGERIYVQGRRPTRRKRDDEMRAQAAVKVRRRAGRARGAANLDLQQG